MQEVLAPLDVLHRVTGLHIEDTYNLILRKRLDPLHPAIVVSSSDNDSALSPTNRQGASGLLVAKSARHGAFRNSALQS